MLTYVLPSLFPSLPQHGSKAASLAVAEQYVGAFSQLAKSSNTLLLPEKTGDVGSMVAQVSCNLLPSQQVS